MYKINPINNSIYQILDEFDGCIYLIKGDKKSLVIDTGMSREKLRPIIEQLTTTPYQVVLTHGHVDHIEQIRLAITDGAEMMGYCPWSAIDLISTHEGMVKRYGFIYVDREEFDLKTLDRYRKDSFYWYKKVIASNGEDLSD